MVVMQKHEGTSMIKFLESAIRSTEAPAVYGHRLSESDVAAIEKYREILAEKRFER